MPGKYFGSFHDREDMAGCFQVAKRDWDDGKYYLVEPIPDSFPTEDEIIFASYGGRDYEGHALVLFEHDGKLYEVHGSHCSCFGLEDQWKPEETSWEAIAMRNILHYELLADHEKDAQDRLAELLLEHGFIPIRKNRYDE